VLVRSTVPDTVSSDRTVLSTYSEVNGKFPTDNHYPVAMKLNDMTSYSNMDFALMSALVPSLNSGISRVLVSYDIGCQWGKHLQGRLDSYTAFPPIKLSNLKYWRVAVPKFHLSGHGDECQVPFNLAFMKGAGRVDGERIEAGWAQTNSMATWTRESGPNARRDILDDHWNASNWQKVLGLGESPIQPRLLYNLICRVGKVSGTYITDDFKILFFSPTPSLSLIQVSFLTITRHRNKTRHSFPTKTGTWCLLSAPQLLFRTLLVHIVTEVLHLRINARQAQVPKLDV